MGPKKTAVFDKKTAVLVEGVDTLDACPLHSRNALRSKKFFILTFALRTLNSERIAAKLSQGVNIAHELNLVQYLWDAL